ncbi:MAG: hypothetical protein RMK29_20895 [Myxococcales bacterium]|nr:hypothetical protein [Myxococcota bacterium]MDW8284171.1 hypothetical protein [Myxococcales bacterium]
MQTPLNSLVATAIVGIDTLWGGDVMSPSGTGRLIADSWFSDEPLPPAYHHPAAQVLRRCGGVSDKPEAKQACAAYLDDIDVRGAIEGIAAQARRLGGPRGAYLAGLADCFAVMWDLAMERMGHGPPVPYERCVRTLLGTAPQPVDGSERRHQVAELLRRSGYLSGGESERDLVAAVDAWRREHAVSAGDIATLGARLISELDALTEQNVVPYLPAELHGVPRANVRFVPIDDAWFSGSMNYLGRTRTPQGLPAYEATYEINAGLFISKPEFWQLISHEVVPGHVTTFAYLQDLYRRGQVGFEATVLTMNTRAAVLFEGIANNAILMAYGVTEVADLPGTDLQIGVLLALLQDDAKAQASYLTWQKGWPQQEVAARIRADFLLSQERADKLSGAWGRHPLLGRMYLPAYRAGTELVYRLRRSHPPAAVLPTLFGCRGLVDAWTVESVLRG